MIDDELSDDELYARLMQVGVSSSDAAWLVEMRDQIDAADEIEERLG